MIRILIFSLFFIYYVYADCKQSVTTAKGSKAPQNICSGNLIFEDNFDALDTGKWKHEQTLSGGGNGEFQWYSDDPKNSYVQNGKLHIKPTPVSDEYGEKFLYHGTIEIPPNKCTQSDSYGCKRTGTPQNVVNPVKSARLNSVDSFSFKFGKVEVRAKLPAGDWLWPAIWLLPKDWKYGSWPASGEIDVMESRGNRQLLIGNTNIGVQQVSDTLHWGPDRNHNKFAKTHFERNLKDGYNSAFHNYQLEWTPNHIKISIDNVQMEVITPPEGGFWQYGDLQNSGLKNPWTNSKMAPFDQEFYLIFNLAVGGTSGYFPDNGNNLSGPKPWSDKSGNAPTTFWQANKAWLPTWNRNTDDSHLQIDYVRVWAL